MAFWSGWGRKGRSGGGTATLTEVLSDNDLVDVVDDRVLLVTPKTSPKQLADVDVRELGSSSPSPFWGAREYNNQLRGHTGLKKFDEMVRSDASVSGSLLLAKTPVLGARWFIEPYKAPGSDTVSARDRNAAQFIWWNLTEGMTTSWPQFLNELLKMLDYGYYMFEKVFTDNHPLKPGMVCWQKMAPRHPVDVSSWLYDSNGGPDGVRMYDERGRESEIPIPIDKLLVFTHEKEGGDMTGKSKLRSAYKHWYMKQNLEKIDAIQKERHGIGVPIIKLPVGFSSPDKLLAEQMGRNLRTNERAHIVLPPMWDLIFAKLEGQPVDTLRSIEYHDRMIWQNVLAKWMSNTSANIKDDDRIFFLQATRYIAECVQDVINKYAIPQLVDYNWSRIKGYPKLRARRIGEQADWRTLTFALRNLGGANMLTPDEALEEQLREEMDLPAADLETRRQTKTPQATAPKAGPPRQTKPSGTPPRGNAGTDQSGG
jgi:hypothetical protein